MCLFLKKIISIFLALCTALYVLPISAFADDTVEYLNYCGKIITNKNLSANISDTYRPDCTFDPETYTLTLKKSMTRDKDWTFTTDHKPCKTVNDIDLYAMISACDGLKDKTLTINVEDGAGTLMYDSAKAYDSKSGVGNYSFVGIYAPETNVVITGSVFNISTPHEAVIANNLTVNNTWFYAYSYVGTVLKIGTALIINAPSSVASEDGGGYRDGTGISARNIIVNNATFNMSFGCTSICEGTRTGYIKSRAVQATNIAVNGGTFNILNNFNSDGFPNDSEFQVAAVAARNRIFGLRASQVVISNGGVIDITQSTGVDLGSKKNNILMYPTAINSITLDGDARISRYMPSDAWFSEGEFGICNSITVDGAYFYVKEFFDGYDEWVSGLYTLPMESTELYIRNDTEQPQYSYASDFGNSTGNSAGYTHDFSSDDFESLLREHKDYKVHILSGDFDFSLKPDDNNNMPEISLEGGTLTFEDYFTDFPSGEKHYTISKEVTLKPIYIANGATLCIKTNYALLNGLTVTGSGNLTLSSGTTSGTVADSIALTVSSGSHNLVYNGTAYDANKRTVTKKVYTCLSEHDFVWNETSAYISKITNYSEYPEYITVFPDKDNHLYLWTPQNCTDAVLSAADASLGTYDNNYRLYSVGGGTVQADGTIYLVDKDFIVDDSDFGDLNYTIGDDLILISDGLYEDRNNFPTAENGISFAWYLIDKNNNRTKLATGSKFTFRSDDISVGDYTIIREVTYKNAVIIRRDYWHIHAVDITQPKDTLAVANKNSTFTVDYNYSSDSYAFYKLQWQVDTGNGFTDIENATAKSYTVTNIAKDNIDTLCTYKYRAAVVYRDKSNNECVFYSNEVSLYQLSMDTHTTKNHIGVGEKYTMTGFDADSLIDGYTVEWYYTDSRDNSEHKINRTDLTYTKTITAEDDYFDYKCIVLYNGVPTGKHTFRIEVVAFDNPENQHAAVGESVTFSADLLKQRTNWYPHYQWQVDKGDGNGFCDIDGATDKTYTFTVDSEDFYNCKYRLCCTWYIIGEFGVSNSETVTYYSDSAQIITAPNITKQPENMTVHISDPTQHAFTVKAEFATSYQWQIKDGDGWKNLDGETNSSLAFAKMSDELNGTVYRCVLSNRLGTSYSDSATLTVKYPPQINDTPENITVDADDEAVFDVDGFTITTDGIELYWQYSKDNGKTWTDVKSQNAEDNIYFTISKTVEIVLGKKDYETGETVYETVEPSKYQGSKLYIKNAAANMDSWLFRCVTEDEFDAVPTTAAMLTVKESAKYNESTNMYEISTIRQFEWFVGLVNGTLDGVDQNAAANAVLKANINAESLGTFGMGSNNNPYTGTFDGNGCTLTVNMNNTEEYTAPFGFVKGATIKNLNVAGTIKTSQKYAASIVGYAMSGNVTLDKCLSTVIINSTVSGDGTHGGLVARVGSNKITITDCGFSGEINGTATDSCGGLVGWISNGGTVVLKNSFVAANFTVSSNRGNTFVRNAQNTTIENCFYLNELNETHANAVKKTAEEFTSGEVAYLLQTSNGRTDLVWGQKSSEDGATPILTSNEDYRVLPVKDGSGIVNYSVLKKGETNNDGQIDIYDYQNLVNIALSENNEKEFAEKYDSNNDGVIDVEDCITAQRNGMSESEYNSLVKKADEFEGMCYMKNADFDLDGVVDVLDICALEKLLSKHRVKI